MKPDINSFCNLKLYTDWIHDERKKIILDPGPIRVYAYQKLTHCWWPCWNLNDLTLAKYDTKSNVDAYDGNYAKYKRLHGLRIGCLIFQIVNLVKSVNAWVFGNVCHEHIFCHKSKKKQEYTKPQHFIFFLLSTPPCSQLSK